MDAELGRCRMNGVQDALLDFLAEDDVLGSNGQRLDDVPAHQVTNRIEAGVGRREGQPGVEAPHLGLRPFRGRA